MARPVKPKHCKCAACHDPRFAKTRFRGYVLQFGPGVSEHHQAEYCLRFARTTSPDTFKTGAAWEYKLRDQIMTRLA